MSISNLKFNKMIYQKYNKITSIQFNIILHPSIESPFQFGQVSLVIILYLKMNFS